MHPNNLQTDHQHYITDLVNTLVPNFKINNIVPFACIITQTLHCQELGFLLFGNFRLSASGQTLRVFNAKGVAEDYSPSDVIGNTTLDLLCNDIPFVSGVVEFSGFKIMVEGGADISSMPIPDPAPLPLPNDVKIFGWIDGTDFNTVGGTFGQLVLPSAFVGYSATLHTPLGEIRFDPGVVDTFNGQSYSLLQQQPSNVPLGNDLLNLEIHGNGYSRLFPLQFANGRWSSFSWRQTGEYLFELLADSADPVQITPPSVVSSNGSTTMPLPAPASSPIDLTEFGEYPGAAVLYAGYSEFLQDQFSYV